MPINCSLTRQLRSYTMWEMKGLQTLPSSLRKYEELCKSDKANVVYKQAVASMDCNNYMLWSLSWQIPLRSAMYASSFDSMLREEVVHNVSDSKRTSARKIKSSKTVPVHCICRMPEIKQPSMIQCSHCKRWYHGRHCVKTPETAWLPGINWLCPSCS